MSGNSGTSNNTGAATLEMLKSNLNKAGQYVSDASARTAEVVTEKTKGLRTPAAAAPGAAAGTGTEAAGTAGTTMERITKSAQESGSYLYNVTRSTTQGLVERFAGGGVAAACAKETKEAPCPRMVIVCCTAIVSGGLASEGVFTTPAAGADVAAVADALAASSCTALVPPGATPQLVSAALKKWLGELTPEPLLTFKLAPALTSPETPREALGAILAELPAANKAALMMILEAAHRVASNAAINDTDAAALAAALSPCLLWRPEPPADPATAAEPKSPGAVVRSQVLPAEEEAEFVKLLTYMISNFRSL